MKKHLGILVLMIWLVSSAAIWAAPSKTAAPIIPSDGVQGLPEGASLHLSETVSPQELAKAEQALTQGSVTNRTNLTEREMSALEDLTDVFDLQVSLPAGQEGSAKNVTVTFEITIPDSVGKVAVMHFISSENYWEILPATVSEDHRYITCTFPSLSPVKIVFVPSEFTEVPSSGPSTGETGEAVVPQPAIPATGDTAPVLGLSILAVICLIVIAVAAVLKRRKSL